MAKFFSDGSALGAVFYDEEDDRYYYDCEHCSYSCSGPDEFRLEIKADNHEEEYHGSIVGRS